MTHEIKLTPRIIARFVRSESQHGWGTSFGLRCDSCGARERVPHAINTRDYFARVLRFASQHQTCKLAARHVDV